jgi:hypothetical protein
MEVSDFSVVLSIAHRMYPVISNPDDPKFDLEKLLQKYEKES